MSWTDLHISDFLGITNKRHPGKNEAQTVDNLDLRISNGDLVTRSFYEPKYSVPYNASLTSNTHLAAENIYIADVGGGQEVTIAVTKAYLSGTPLTCVWASHQWNGSSWDSATNWHWLNECVKTTVTSRTTYSVVTGLSIADNQYNGWYVYNVTKDEYARIFISKAPNVINLTDNTGSWDASDALILMRNYIPYEALTGNYNAGVNDISFHKVINGIRIGFGGQSDRYGLTVMYVNSSYNLAGFDFGDSDYSNATNLANFASVDRIICEVYNGRPLLDADVAMVVSETRGEDNIPHGDYQARMTTLLDGYNHFVDSNIYDFTSNAFYFICEFTPKIATFGNLHRLTEVNIFMSQDDGDFNFTKKLDFSSNDVSLKINTHGYIYPLFISESERYLDSDAASWDEANTTGTWAEDAGTLSVETSAPLSGTYSLKLTGSGLIQTHQYLDTSYANRKLRVVCKFKAPVGTSVAMTLSPIDFIPGKPVVGSQTYNFTADGTTQDIEHTFDIATPVRVITFAAAVGSSESLWVDTLHVYMQAPFALRILTLAQAIKDYIGYAPTTDYIQSWDQAVVASGKTFFINPYIDRQYINKIFTSVIGVGFQYDVAIPDNYYDLENFDGNNLVGIAILRNLNIIVFRQNSVQYLNSSSSQVQNIEIGNGCVNRRTIVTIGDKVYWCGEYGIFFSDGTNIQDITAENIKSTYRGLSKTSMRAGKEEDGPSYVFTATGLSEYVYTPRGWVTRDCSPSSIDLITAKDGSLWRYSNSGVTYPTSTQSSDSYIFGWKSIPFDAQIEELSETQRLKIRSYSIGYKALGSFTLTVRVYLDGSLYLTTNHSITSGERVLRHRLPLVVDSPFFKSNASKRFEIELSGNAGANAFTIKYVGIEWKAIAEGING